MLVDIDLEDIEQRLVGHSSMAEHSVVGSSAAIEQHLQADNLHSVVM